MKLFVKLSLRLYRTLLVLYPVQFRREYGPLMAAFFEEACEECLASGRLLPLLRLWWRTLIDLGVSTLTVRLDGNRRNVMPWRSWLLWILASVAGWMAAGLFTYPMLTSVTILIGGVLVTALHTLLLQRFTASANWWRYALPLNVGSWLIPLCLLPIVPWSPAAALVRWEQLSGWVPIITTSILLVFSAALGGIMQGFALRPLLRSPWRWATVPAVALLIALATAAGLSYTLIPLAANLAQSGTFSMALPSSGFISPTVVDRLGILFVLLNLFIAVAASASYGLVTGAAFVTLSSDDSNAKTFVLT